MATNHVAVGPKNRTNVRTKDWTLEALRLGLRAVEGASPSLAARVGEHLMFRTRRWRPAESERAILARGERFDVDARVGRLAAWSFGEGPLVLLVHGWNGRGGQLGAFVEPLVHAGFRVVTFDAPGHGASEGGRASILDFADAVDAMLDATRPHFQPAHAIVAHSMGAPAVTYAMSRFRGAADFGLERGLREAGLPVRRFVFVAPPVDVRDFVRGFSRVVGFDDGTREALRRRIETTFAIDLERLYAPKLAREMDAPLLVVHDEDDREVPVRCGQLFAEAWPGARLRVTTGLGHTRILRDPTVVADVVSFLAG